MLATVRVIAAMTASGNAMPRSPKRFEPRFESVSGPNTSRTTRAMPNTPLLTTATAWSSPETGVGATIALGSHWWSGISPALTPKPSARTMNASDAAVGSALASAAIPPGVKSTVALPAGPAILVSQ